MVESPRKVSGGSNYAENRYFALYNGEFMQIQDNFPLQMIV